MQSKKSHWEKVYETKSPQQVSWTQVKPTTSIELILQCGLDKNASIIDIGAGDSNLVDYLLEEGYTNITVLDISSKAIERAKTRLGDNASKVNWIVSDIINYKPTVTYDIWHDRAAFHFLTSTDDIKTYANLTDSCVNDFLVLGTFSEDGPLKCSGLDITQYNEEKITQSFSNSFVLKSSRREDHTTPFETKQNFLFSLLQKK
jgi:SAM-dependent methyltransferase